jgi:integrase/recombinase XerD
VIAARVAAYPGLPIDDGLRCGVRRRTEDWLLRARSAHTEKARAHDLGMFLAWCHERGIDPLTACPADLGWYRVWRELHGAGGRCAKPTTVARALASISSWYTHLAGTAAGSIAHNPLMGVARPPVSAYAAGSPGPGSDEVDVLLAHADARAVDRTRRWLDDPSDERLRQRLVGLRDRAVLRLLADLGLRVGQALERDVADVTVSQGSWVVRYPGRAGDVWERVLPAGTLAVLDEYLAARAAAAGVGVAQLTGALFATFRRDGSEGRLVEPNAFMMIRSFARQAGIASADMWSPQSLRHAFAAAAFRAGVPLQDVQDALGHADPRTTRRYDPAGYSAVRDPAHYFSARR